MFACDLPRERAPTLTPFLELELRGYEAPFDDGDSEAAVGAELVFGLNVSLR